MIFYNISSGTINFFNDDKSIGRVSIPEIKSNLFKEIYIKTVIFLVTSNFPKYNQIKIPLKKLSISNSDIEYINKFRTILEMEPIKVSSEKIFDDSEMLSFLGTPDKKENKHIVFFSGGKESWYKILYLLNILNINQEDILVIYINKWNGTSGKESNAIVSLNEKFPKINIKVIDVSITIKKKHAYALEYLVILAASLEQIFLFSGGTDIHFGFSNISWKNKDTYIDSFSETIEAEELYFTWLKKYNINLDKIIRLEIPEYDLYDYELFREYEVIDSIVSCITPDGLSTLSRNTFKEKFPELIEFIDDNMCCYCTKDILKFFNKIKYANLPDKWYKDNKDVLKRVISKHIDNKLIPIQKGDKKRQFFNYDVHFISYIYNMFSEISKKIDN